MAIKRKRGNAARKRDQKHTQDKTGRRRAEGEREAKGQEGRREWWGINPPTTKAWATKKQEAAKHLPFSS
jgi:hypothetical protein